MAYENAAAYNDPAGGTPSDAGSQINMHVYRRKALLELQEQKYFTQLADTYTMPRHYGKTIRQYLVVPLLHDANINSQGIDAAGVTTTRLITIVISTPGAQQGLHSKMYVPGEGPNDAAALAAAELYAERLFKSLGLWDTDYATTKANLQALPEPWVIDDANASVPVAGNLYGSSRDVAYMTSRYPALGEHGGRYNRVSVTRKEVVGTMDKFGFFQEYTKDSLMFDTMADWLMHIDRELLRGGHQLIEDMVQNDLLNSPGIVIYAGTANAAVELSGDVGGITELGYSDISHVSIDLDNNNCPRHTEIITGSKLTDTRVLRAARVAYIGPEVIPTLEEMTDSFGDKVLIPHVQYADANSNSLNGEYGAIKDIRFVVNQNMNRWEGAGAPVTPGQNAGYYETGGNYDVFPVLIVGNHSFTTISFERSKGKNYKFQIIHKKPGPATADRSDPYGQTGFISIMFWYGTMIQRPEWIACLKTVAKY